MRILVGGISHESNSLNPIITAEEDFVVFRGNEIVEKGMLPHYSAAGIINTLREAGLEIVPALVARAVPNGVVSGAFYSKIKAEFLDRATEAGSIDGICLALHGSMKVEPPAEAEYPPVGLGCAEGDLCSALREIFPGIPMTAALDMHATITGELLMAVNGFAGYMTAPHVDCAETGARAARMLLKAIKDGVAIRTVCRKIPMMIAGEKSETQVEPMASLIGLCRLAESESGIEAASLFLGFPWADDENNAVSVLVSFSDGNSEKAERIADDLAAAFWKQRAEFAFSGEFYFAEEALAAAYAYVEKGERPVFISDSGDNPTAGSTGDSTDLLEAILKTIARADSLPTPLLYSGFFDASAAAACVRAGEGAELRITLGGNWDTVNGKKIPLNVTVKKIRRDYGPYKSDLVLAAYRNLLVSVTSKHIGFGDGELLPALGVNAADHCLVVVKLGYLEPCFSNIAKRAIMATTRGCSNEVLETIPYKRVPRPIYPLDKDMEWSVATAAGTPC
ncbi:MAG: M81 family metallopeptidase [Treponema sp.]|jgi:microcystin degradation protein MlrC|nr:M81 family metallopeptidase [Treponema sp.]